MIKQKLVLFISLVLMVLPLSVQADTKTWTMIWDKAHTTVGSEGFYNFGTSYVVKDVYTTTLNGLEWSIRSEGTHTYAYVKTGGQTIGKNSEAASHTEMWTTALAGKIKAVRVTAKTAKEENQANVSVIINGQKYLSDGNEAKALTSTHTEHAFAPNGEAQEGKIQINLDQTSEKKNVLYIKKVEIDYEVIASAVAAPTFSLAGGIYDTPQTVALSAEGLETGTYSIYYTTDGSNPRIEGESRTLYTTPLTISETTTLKACVKKGEEYSDVSSATYVIRKEAGLSFNKTYIELLSGNDGVADLLNPNKLEPITYKSSAWNVCSVDEYGVLSSSYVERDSEVTISAVFAGNDTYKPQTVEMKVLVKTRTPLKTPVVAPMGGTFSAPVEVTISTDDENAVTIWYSDKAASEEEFVGDYTKSVITESREVKFTIDKSCRLYVMTRGYNVNSAVVTANFIINEPLEAKFTTDKAVKEVYTQGFDSKEEVAEWTVGNGWKLANASFSEINAKDKTSASISYQGSGTTELTSPEMLINENSAVEFYAKFSGVFLYDASWQFNVIDEENNTVRLMDAFTWAQENSYTGPIWNKFSFDLKPYAGKKVKFQFFYKFGGEDLAVDGFRIVQDDPASTTQINIFEGETIRYNSLAQGEPEAVEWAFDGGTPATSTETNPVITYNKAGTYNVTFTVRRGEEKATTTRENYIVVSQRGPEARIGLPEEGYESPYVGVFVPTDVPVTFRDLSANNPTEWKWAFQNTDTEESTEQNPTVTYINKGVTSVGLIAKNNVGSSQDMMVHAIQAGGYQEVWNIGIEENQNIAKIALGFYGNYAGSNWAGWELFAEEYKAPLADARIESVAVYFATTTTVSPDAEITLTINSRNEDGLPGEELAKTSLKASQLAYDADNVVATIFRFPNSATIKKGQQFFVTIGPFPNKSIDVSPYADDIAIYAVRRAAGEKCTTFHFMEDQDNQGHSLGTKSWYKNVDDPLSLTIAPVINYDTAVTGINNVQPSNTIGEKQIDSIFTVAGTRVSNTDAPGVYIIKYTDGSTIKVRR